MSPFYVDPYIKRKIHNWILLKTMFRSGQQAGFYCYRTFEGHVFEIRTNEDIEKCRL